MSVTGLLLKMGRESGDERLIESETRKVGDISVARMNISDGSIDFQDLTLSPGLKTTLTALNGDFVGINLAEKAKPVMAELDGQVGEFGVVNIKSQLLPADPTQASEIKYVDEEYRHESIVTIRRAICGQSNQFRQA